MERIYTLAPGLLLFSALLVAFLVYCVRCAIGRPPEVPGVKAGNFLSLFWSRFFYWVLTPAERAISATRISPDLVTLASFLAAVMAGVAIAMGHLATAGWLYILSGALDMLDGKIARAQGRQTRSGALLDSVCDRWAELAVLFGFAWFLRATPWLLTAMGAITGSMMVSYTRARGESLGILLNGGVMARAERMMLVSVGTLITAWFATGRDTSEYGPAILGVTLLLCALGAIYTAVQRLVKGYLQLRAEEGISQTSISSPQAPKVPQ